MCFKPAGHTCDNHSLRTESAVGFGLCPPCFKLPSIRIGATVNQGQEAFKQLCKPCAQLTGSVAIMCTHHPQCSRNRNAHMSIERIPVAAVEAPEGAICRQLQHVNLQATSNPLIFVEGAVWRAALTCLTWRGKKGRRCSMCSDTSISYGLGWTILSSSSTRACENKGERLTGSCRPISLIDAARASTLAWSAQSEGTSED